jgi:two-component system, chemotaxis family, protein-glutamate methylesterase/glutaminase
MNKIIVIAASTGGLEPLRLIVGAFPDKCSASVFVVVHIGNHRSNLPLVLSWSTKLSVSFAEDAASIQPGHIYVARPQTMTWNCSTVASI